MNIFRKSDGFAVVEAALVVLALAIIGGTGYFVYHSQKETKSLLDSTAETLKAKPAPKKAATVTSQPETANWKEVKNQEFGYSFKMPTGNDWTTEVLATDRNSEAYREGERINNEYVTYTECGRNCGLAFGIRVAVAGSQKDVGPDYPESSIMKDNAVYSLASKKSVSIGNVKGTKWQYTTVDRQAADIVYYYYKTSKFSYFIEVNMNGATADGIDITVQGDKIASTLKFQ